MNKTLIIMSAVIPTVGHKALIEYARTFSDRVCVLINGKTWEPTKVEDRISALWREYPFSRWSKIVLHGVTNDDGPEIDDGTDEFWDYWVNLANDSFGGGFTHIATSEPWGRIMAEKMGIRFIPFDITRTVVPISGEKVRNNLWEQWDNILPTFWSYLPCYRYVLFGQESTGKTTISKEVAKELRFCDGVKAKVFPEWARQYLEATEPLANAQRMRDIVLGQGALEQYGAIQDTPVQIYDTDLWTTYGYYRIMRRGGDPEYDPEDALGLINNLRAKGLELPPKRLYFLMPDDVPFKPDPLRYGGDKRTSSHYFWEDTLLAEDLPYMQVPRGTLEDKVDFIVSQIRYDLELGQQRFTQFHKPRTYAEELAQKAARV